MFAGAVTSIVQVLRAGTMEARENAAVTLFTLTLAGVNKITNGSLDLLDNGSPKEKNDAVIALFELLHWLRNHVLMKLEHDVVVPLVDPSKNGT
ncbi:hypothetical protein YC2023_113718 [Brassica napus]